MRTKVFHKSANQNKKQKEEPKTGNDDLKKKEEEIPLTQNNVTHSKKKCLS